MAIPTYGAIIVGDDEAAIFGAVSCAETLKKYGDTRQVALLPPGTDLGGISGNELGSSDIGKTKILGGAYRNNLSSRAGRRIGLKTSYKEAPFNYTDDYRRMLAEAGVMVYQNAKIDSVVRVGTTTESLQTTDGRVFKALRWGDGGRFGDLLRRIVPPVTGWTIGMESRAAYNESFAGFGANFERRDQSPLDENGDLWSMYIRQYPGYAILGAHPGVQCWGLRTMVSNELGFKLPWEKVKTENYDPAKFKFYDYRYGLNNPFNRGGYALGMSNLNDDLFLVDPVDDVPYHHKYPLVDYETRAAYDQMIINHVRDKLYYLATDPSRAGAFQDQMQAYGPPIDDGPNNGGMPTIPYMREGVRMIGTYVTRQSDLDDDNEKEDGVACFGYAKDGHQRHAMLDPDNPDGFMYEGAGIASERFIHEAGASAPYRSMLPQAAHSTDTLVWYCFSCTSTVWMSGRIVTFNSMFGEAGGVALALSLINNVALHDLDTDELRAECLSRKMIVDPVYVDDEPDPEEPPVDPEDPEVPGDES